ncbi:hypothetical protein ACI2K4_18565 [Micromonospora sp. NPDC050397]|uniref:hypothetical protein n=1 Tax=Micromonospora sp. NPDC050397 TaxID=3364279 RepID=UPI0038502D04
MTGRAMFDQVALGLIPLVPGTLAIRHLHPGPAIDQTAREPDPPPAVARVV